MDNLPLPYLRATNAYEAQHYLDKLLLVGGPEFFLTLVSIQSSRLKRNKVDLDHRSYACGSQQLCALAS